MIQKQNSSKSWGPPKRKEQPVVQYSYEGYIPADVVRLILLESPLRVIHAFLTSSRLHLSDMWWKQYMTKRIPSKCHPLLDTVGDMKTFMKTEGVYILQRVNEGNMRYFDLEAAFHQMDLVTLFQEFSIATISLCESELSDGTYREVCIATHPSNRSKCMISMNEIGDSSAYGLYHNTMEDWSCPLEELPSLIHNILLFGGKDDFKSRLNNVDTVQIWRDYEVIRL